MPNQKIVTFALAYLVLVMIVVPIVSAPRTAVIILLIAVGIAAVNPMKEMLTILGVK